MASSAPVSATAASAPAAPGGTPPAAPIVSNLVNRTFGLWFPFFRWMARTLPSVAVARLAGATAERAIWERDAVHAAILENMSRVLQLPANDRRVEEAGRAMVALHSRFWIDLLRHSRRGGSATSLCAKRIGDEHLREANRGGKGAILLTAHVGNFEIGGLFMRDLEIPFSVVYAPDPSPVIEAHRERARQEMGVVGIPVTTSPFAFLPILRALAENRFVAMQGDRDVSGTGWQVPFLGTVSSFPIGPYRIAAQAGAPILPSFVLQEPDGRYRSVIEPPIRIPAGLRGAELDAALREALRNFVRILERTIRENPTQWYRFETFAEPPRG